MRSRNSIKQKSQHVKDTQLPNSSSYKYLPYRNLNEKLNLVKTNIQIPSQQFEQERIHYEWRAKTEFPIVKVFAWKILNNLTDSIELEIQNQVYPMRLMELKDIPLFKLIYLLKESLIGFERLYNRFGSFLVTPKMIGINEQHKCKVWMNENFALNQFKSFSIDQMYFLSSIFKMFESRCSKTKTSINFFQQILKYDRFCTALGFVENFARDNKLGISTFFKLAGNQTSMQGNKGIAFESAMSFSKTPKFISDFRSFKDTTGKHAGLSIVSMINKEIQRNLTVSIEFKNELKGDMKMKQSNQTQADIYTSNTLTPTDSKSNTGEKELVEVDKLQKKQIFKSESQIKPESRPFQFKRKLSTTTDNYGYCLTPMPKKINHFQLEEDRPFLQSRRQSYEQEDHGITEAIIGQFFEKNKWEKTIDGLFKDNSQLKKSFHEGKERKCISQTVTLQLLDKVGKTVYQSMMEDEEH